MANVARFMQRISRAAANRRLASAPVHVVSKSGIVKSGAVKAEAPKLLKA